MNVKFQILTRCASVLGAVLLLNQPVQADLGKYRYACQVTTVNDLQGFLMIRTDSMEEAEVMAQRAKRALTRYETREPVKNLVQCVEYPDGRFTDQGFQAFADNVPR